MPVTRSNTSKERTTEATSGSTRDWSMVTPSTTTAATTTTGASGVTGATGGETLAGTNVPPSGPAPAPTPAPVGVDSRAGTASTVKKRIPPAQAKVTDCPPDGGRMMPPPLGPGPVTQARTRTSRSSKKKEVAEARLRLAEQRLEQAKAQAEVAKAQLELAEADSEDEEMDLEMELHRTTHVEQWVAEVQAQQHQPQEEPPSAPRCAPEKTDIQLLTEAILRATGGRTSGAAAVSAELPNFGGNIEEWLAFKRQYDESAPAFTKIQNMARLRKTVVGSAREAVKSLLLVSSEPGDVVAALERRFGRPEAIVIAEIEKMKRHPALTDAPRDICVFASKVNNVVATVRALAKPHYLHSPELSRLIVEKLSPIGKFRWYDFRARFTVEEEPELVKLDRFLTQEADVCGLYVSAEATPRYTRNTRFTANVHEEEELKTEEVVAATSVEEKTCAFCKKDHQPYECKAYREATVEQRWKMVVGAKLCFRCLRKSHRSSTCKRPPCKTCKRNHHVTLHQERKEEDQPAAVNTTVLAAAVASTAYLKIIPVEVYGPAGSDTILALMDEGSTVTMLDNVVAKKIGVEGELQPLNIRTISGGRVTTLHSCQADLEIRGVHRREKLKILNVRTIDDMKLPTQRVTREDLAACEHLQKIIGEITFPAEAPQMIIGQDNWGLIVSRRVIQGKPSQPVASFTRLGWVLHGVHAGFSAPVNLSLHCSEEKKEEKIEKMVKDFFSIDALGIAARNPSSDVEEKATKMLQETTRRLPGGRFEAGLLWTSQTEELPNNREMAMKRLKSMEKKLERDVDLKTQYGEQIENLLKKGYAEEAPPTQPTRKRTFYLPHFAVTHPTKKKIRLVFDAAARCRGRCLNDALLSGPDQLQSLFGVLVRFREKPIAVMGDIREMFLQIRIREEDRDSLRFLWRPSGEEDVREYRMTSVVFGATSSPAIAIYVKNRNAQEFEQQYPEACKAIVRNHYMDDYLQSFSTAEEAKKTASEVDLVHRKAGFELRGWASNSAELRSHFAADDQATEVEIAPGDEKTLGLLWRTGADAIAFNVGLRNTPAEVIDGQRKPTKREVMSAVMSTFDPLGLLAPVLVQGKKLIQRLWRAGLQWDEDITEDIWPAWKTYIAEVRGLHDLSVPRSLTKMKTTGELHVFVDASEEAYAAAAYWRSVEEDGAVRVVLIAGKAKVAPTKPVSIPRLELQAAVLGSRLARSIGEETDLQIQKRVFWSDSSTVLQWIRAEARKFKTFVAHRLAELEDSTKTQEWRYVPTKENPADDATRGVPKKFDAAARWFVGPDFLRRDEEDWPANKQFKKEVTGEERVIEERVAAVSVALLATPDELRFSSWRRLLRTTARVLQFVDLVRRKPVVAVATNDAAWRPHMKKRLRQTKRTPVAVSEDRFLPIDGSYLLRAEKLLMKKVQEDSFAEELKTLGSGKKLRRDSRLSAFEVCLDEDGVLRMKGRIGKVEGVDEETKRPAVLDGRHRISVLLLEDYHRRFLHGSHAAVVNEVRQRYYITGLRSAIRKVAHGCSWCRVRKTTPRRPPTGDLPSERLQHHRRPFTCAAVDYFGPMKVTIGRRQEKRWGVLFTCLTTRAIHVELAQSLSTSSMVLALRRMAARRGTPATLFSDNGTNFVGADRELQEEYKKMKQEDIATAIGLRWKFIAPGAPNMGGAWERMVRSVKTALYAVLSERAPSEETLHTLLTEIEHTVNSRPLTHISTDPADPECLTPNHFLLGRSNGAPVVGDFDDTVLLGKADWRTAQRLADHFWRRWMKEYLPELVPRRTKHEEVAVGVGDVVIIADGTLPRNLWPRGQVTKVLVGPDGRTRTVDVRTTGGTFRRPVSRLVVVVPASTSSG